MVDIIVLACFAVAQPLFGVLSNAAGLFVVDDSKAIDVVLLAFGMAVVPGLCLLAVEFLAALFGPNATRVAHRVILSLLLALTLLPIVKRAALPGFLSVAIALALGAALVGPYLRARTWRWSAVYLTPALVVLPSLLLFHSPISAMLWAGQTPQALRTRVGNPVPVVLIVFDEFPLASLMAEDGTIDEKSYPTFAELARQGTWYRNATTVSDGTLIAVPAILDGNYPTPDQPRLPDAAGHPNSLFTLLGDSYHMHAEENNTHVCPDNLCGDVGQPFLPRFRALVRDAFVLWPYAVLPSDMTGSLPDISQMWGNFTAQPSRPATLKMWESFDERTNWRDRVQEFRKFTNGIEATDWPTLHFLHILLPHAPWEYLPSGQRYPAGEARIRGLRGQNDRGEDVNRWLDDDWAAAQSYQRHLLQVGTVDRLIGEMLQRLRDKGIYDDAVVIITADHGTSFRPGESRRSLSQANRGDILAVPLFIKYPHQQSGGVDDRGAQTIDILPTLIDVLQVRSGWKLDGKSLARSTAGTAIKQASSGVGSLFKFPGSPDALMDSLKYKFRIFGGSGEEALYRAGDSAGLVGRAATAAASAPGLGYKLEREAYYTKVDPGASMVATEISGRVLRSGRDKPGKPMQLALAVNGTIRAVTWSYAADGQDEFEGMIPENSLRAGRNDIGVFLVRDGNQLARLKPTVTQPYHWGTRLSFGKDGTADPYFGTGWSGPEGKVNWTDGHTATLYLPAAPPGADVTLTAALAAFTRKGRLESQH
ncbi:MAG TPA: sulfatase-like hydrolase/transferase, partial [Bryobacteraceae bacterium]